MNENLADYHIHTSFCNHANGTMKEYVKHAIAAGLREMGFSDHNPFPQKFNNQYRMLPEDMEIYLNTIYDLQENFPQILIKVGMELDYVKEATDYSRNFSEAYNFDYIIGSVHYLNINSSHRMVYLDDLHYENKTKLFRKYFESIEEAVSTGLFDIIAHFDLPRRFWGNLDDESVQYAEHTLEIIKKYDVCLEINTSGFRTKYVEEPFPGNRFLRLVKEMDIPIILGSDAHSPRDVGSYFQETIELLKKIGFKKINCFSSRKRRSILI